MVSGSARYTGVADTLRSPWALCWGQAGSLSTLPVEPILMAVAPNGVVLLAVQRSTCWTRKGSFLNQRRQWRPTPVLLPGKSHGQRSLVGCSPWGRKESDTTEQLHFRFPVSCIGEGNGNPLHCSCLENPRDGGACWAAIYTTEATQQQQQQHSWTPTYVKSQLHHLPPPRLRASNTASLICRSTDSVWVKLKRNNVGSEAIRLGGSKCSFPPLSLPRVKKVFWGLSWRTSLPLHPPIENSRMIEFISLFRK